MLKKQPLLQRRIDVLIEDEPFSHFSRDFRTYSLVILSARSRVYIFSFFETTGNAISKNTFPKAFLLISLHVVSSYRVSASS